MDGIEVKTTQDDIIIAHQAKKIVFLELQLSKALNENRELKNGIQGISAEKKEG